METETVENQFFSFTPDSAGPALTMVMDTLRQRNHAEPFVKNFINQQGIPSWDHYSVFPKKDRLVMLVPVSRPAQKSVTGVWAISIKQKQPTFRWIPRGAELEGPNKPDKTALEVFMLGFENRIFGKVQVPSLTVETKTSKVAKNKFGAPLMKSGWRRVPVDERCYRVDVGSLHGRNPEHTEAYLDYYRGNWECEYIYDWVYFDDGRRDGDGSGDDGRDGSGGGNGGSSGSFTGQIDATDLKNHPQANCIYGKLNQTGTMKDVVSKFAGENTNFNLEITVGNVEGGFGTLNSTRGSNTFQMKIDQEGLLQRKSIQTAATFLHEAIHAEMRRYLRGATDTSTLSGFPGSFSHD